VPFRESSQKEPIRQNQDLIREQEIDVGWDGDLFFEPFPDPENPDLIQEMAIRAFEKVRPHFDGLVDIGSPGIANGRVLRGWLRQYELDFVVAQILAVIRRRRGAKGSSESIKSWEYFADEIERNAGR
jgi:hypothetical protein